ncbi:MAG TPA: hypothetical protein VF471_07840 [Pseudoxanthomonas sp.]
MGAEIIYPIAWLISLIAIVWLVGRSRNPHSRPYALPTLFLSLAIALFWAWADHKPGLFWQYVFVWFAPVVLVLGSQAHAIRWLVGRARSSGAP